MKRFLTLFTVVMALVFVTTPHADAKKFGGGKSFGKSFKTAPAPAAKTTNTSSLNGKTQKPASSKKGLIGGLLGGLLAGSLLAAMFGGAFDGIQFMDILIFGLIAFALFKLFKHLNRAKFDSMRQQKQAYAHGNQQQYKQPDFNNTKDADFNQPSGGFGQQNNSAGFGQPASDVPFNLPPGFDLTAFLNGSREHYRIIQGAWNFNQIDTIQEYVSPELFAALKEERQSLEGEQHTEVMFVDAELVRAEHDTSIAQVSIQFSGRYRDTVEKVEEGIKDIWHLERDLLAPNAPWLIVGIENS
ncbi:TIM44-like domain-containing protein [Vibrio sp. SS-MA-C1-2]|uniref:Tim44 domain-containing protein n=1 Tax=Vibrio sp. SS-MA-C1-2 TaxID=2908646 RepID=UPI001F3E7CCD|nr:TIM44-like domain-containing protein [Vibrio sp. SS-MA-C1-2]UJF19840.1 TIM44-like domain-containing protein [Vibrio sp. SS-MA-C1-2]